MVAADLPCLQSTLTLLAWLAWLSLLVDAFSELRSASESVLLLANAQDIAGFVYDQFGSLEPGQTVAAGGAGASGGGSDSKTNTTTASGGKQPARTSIAYVARGGLVLHESFRRLFAVLC